jgi:hypothetical protein
MSPGKGRGSIGGVPREEMPPDDATRLALPLFSLPGLLCGRANFGPLTWAPSRLWRPVAAPQPPLDSLSSNLPVVRAAGGAAPPVVRAAGGAAPPVARAAGGAAPPVARAAGGAAPPVARAAGGAAPPVARAAGGAAPRRTAMPLHPDLKDENCTIKEINFR